MPVEHMPGYFVLLHFWLQLVGPNDFAIRFLSVLPSTLAVALAFRLTYDLAAPASIDEPSNGKMPLSHPSSRVGQAIAACASAAILATAAFQIWYAQEARMYSWLLAAGLTSYLFFWRLLNSKTGKGQLPILLVAGYVLSTALSIYLHFYGFLVPITQSAFAVGWVLVTRQWRHFIIWVGAGLLIFLIFLPWLPRTLQINSFGGWRDPGDPWQIPWRYTAASHSWRTVRGTLARTLHLAVHYAGPTRYCRLVAPST